MSQSELSIDHFPLIYEHGRPTAVLIDLKTFQHIVDALDHLKDLTEDEDEARWIMDIVQTKHAYRQAHPDDVLTYDSPEAILAALDGPDA
jgi:hypothetical protein